MAFPWCVSSDADRGATAARLAELCAHAQGQALAVLRDVGHPLRALLIDPIHVDRSGGTPAEVAAVPRGLLPYAQFCDAPAERPDPQDFAAVITDAIDLRRRNAMSQTIPPVFLLSTIKIRPGKMTEFCELMPRIVAIMEGQGWRLVCALTNLGGRINVVVDLWQIPDANALPNGLGVLTTARDWPDISRALAEYVEDEVIQLMSRLPFDTARIPDHWA